MFFYIAIIIIYLPCLILFPTIVKGKKNLKKLKKSNYIASCNHMSNIDPVMLDITLHKKFRILAKIELFRHKFFSACLKSFGAIPINRKEADITGIKATLKVLNEKNCVAIFPQGTRKNSPIIEEGSQKEGVAMFAIRTNTPVVPMMYTRKFKVFRFTKLIVGEPIYPDATRLKDKNYINEFSNLITERMNKLLEGDYIK